MRPTLRRRPLARGLGGFIAILLGASVLGQDPLHRRFTTRDGLPSNTIYQVMQDREGYMWFATDQGACRFDGRSFRTYTTDDGLAHNDVLEIHQDSQGRLWFLSFNGHLSFLQNGVMHHERNTPFLKACSINAPFHSFAEARNGDVWFGAIPGDVLVLRTDGSAERLPPPPAPDIAVFLGTTVARDGDSMFVTHGTAVYRVAPHGRAWRLLQHVPGLTCVSGPAAPPYRGWILEKRGLCVIDAGGTPHLRVAIPSGLAVVNSRELRVSRGINGDVWVCGLDRGLLHVTEDARNGNGDEIFFLDERITSVAIDAAGDVWASTLTGGVILVPREQLGTICFRGRSGAAREEFKTLALARDGTLWAGSDAARIYHVQASSLQTFLVDQSAQPAGRINALAEALDGSIWFTGDAGTGRLVGPTRPERWNAHTDVDMALPASGHKSIAVAPDGSIYLGMFGLKRLANGHYETPFKSRTRAYHLLFGADGALWFDQQDTLVRLGPADTHRYLDWTGDRYGTIRDLALLGDTIVVGTAAGGVGLLHNGHAIAQYDRNTGLASDQCRAVHVHGGFIHVVTATSLSSIDPRSGRITDRSLEDLLGTSRVNDLAVDDEHIYLASAEGLIVLPRSTRPGQAARAPLRFAQVLLNGREQPLDRPVDLQQGKDQLVLVARLLCYTLAGIHEFEYRLRPDQPWIANSDGRLELAALEPGAYDLRIRARAPGRPWSDELHLAIRVSPPLWRSRPVLALYVAIGSMLMLLVLRWWNLRRWRARTAALRQEQALTRERQRIAMDVHDDLGADISNLLLLSRLAGKEQHGRSSTIQRMESLAASMMLRIDEIIWSLDPQQDTLGATVAFLDRYSGELARAHNLTFRSRVLDTEDPTPLPAPYRRDLYLIVKEVVNNVARHAKATRLQFHAERDARSLVLVLTDDGTGMPPAAANDRRGNGLGNMQRRARHMNGEVFITPAPTGGTRVTIRLPLGPHPPNG